MNFQPSELAKFAIALYAADYMVRKMDVKENFFRAVLPMGVSVAVVGVLLLAEPDMGAFMVIAMIAMGILFLGGVNARMFFLIAAVLIGAFVLMIALERMAARAHLRLPRPWDEKYTLGKGYQLSHSLIAIGRGEIFGVGLGGSVEKLHCLPEAHTDFLLAVIGEEFGLVGVAAVIVAFFWLARRMIHIGRQAIALDRVFAGLVAQGVGIWMGFQAFINMGVNLGALPTKGLTLPLMSYGGSAILVNLVAMADVLRSRHARTGSSCGRARMSQSAHRHLVVMAGGTGGHIFPAWPWRARCSARGWTVSWLGTTAAAWRASWCRRAASRSRRIDFSGLRGKGAAAHAGPLPASAAGLLERLASCAARRADAVLGLGGYVSFPGGLMAVLLGKPLVLLKPTRRCDGQPCAAPVADRVAFGFDGDGSATTQQARRHRQSGARGDRGAARPGASASPGAAVRCACWWSAAAWVRKVLNETLPQALALIPPAQRPQRHPPDRRSAYRRGAGHLCGGRRAGRADALHRRHGARLADCDLIVCRAGAVTVSELCAAGVAALLVPLIVSTTSHQRDNAQLAPHGAAIHLSQADLTPQGLADLLAD